MWQNSKVTMWRTIWVLAEVRLDYLPVPYSVTVRVKKRRSNVSARSLGIRADWKIPVLSCAVADYPGRAKFIRISRSFTILLLSRVEYPAWREIDERYGYWITGVPPISRAYGCNRLHDSQKKMGSSFSLYSPLTVRLQLVSDSWGGEALVFSTSFYLFSRWPHVMRNRWRKRDWN